MRTGSGTNDIYQPTLWYYELLSFTTQCQTGRKGKTNYVCAEDENISVWLDFFVF